MKKLPKQIILLTLQQSSYMWKAKLSDPLKFFIQWLMPKNMVTKISLVAALFLLAAAPTYSQDADNDGVLDNVDLDNDNDGIIDTIECPIPIQSTTYGHYTRILPSMMGIPMDTSGVDTIVDLSSYFSLPTGSVIVEVQNGLTHATQDLFMVYSGDQDSTDFYVSGTYSTFIYT